MFHQIERALLTHEWTERCMLHCQRMDAKSLEILDLPAVLAQLANFTHFSASQTLALELDPKEKSKQVTSLQTETTEARRLLSSQSDFSVRGARDVRSLVQAASRGAVLEPLQLLEIQRTLEVVRNLLAQMGRFEEPLPRLGQYVSQLDPLASLIKAISRVLDESGEVKDDASEKLRTIRREYATSQARLNTRLQKLITNPKIVPLLQEPIITQRDGRSVILLRAEFKGRIESVVHDQSASGATMFVEPLQVVELNNKVRELELAERDEIRRILTELSSRAGEHEEAIRINVEALAQLDLGLAKARYAEAIDGTEPLVHPIVAGSEAGHPGSVVRLIDARHPLLDPDSVVPISMVLDDQTFALVITGPNTGGKTVTLKTAGLLALMTQCGLHIPAASGSEISVFNNVFADIGDEQSVEQSLSTFSAHISNIIRIIGFAGEKSLVLLDELGAGTDPQEGSALARSILAELLGRKVTTLVATHYPELKAYAHTTPGVRNASVEFDLESLRPTYRLSIGLPGRSNALSIADRLGLGQRIVDRAREMVSPNSLRTETLLDEIHHQRELAEQARSEAEKIQHRVADLEKDLEARWDAIEGERRELLAETRDQSAEEVERVRSELDRLRRRLSIAAQPLKILEPIESSLKELEESIAESDQDEDPKKQSDHLLAEGDRVHLRTINAIGTIEELGSSHAEVLVGRLRVRASLDELSPSDQVAKVGLGSSRSKEGRVNRDKEITQAPAMELDLRGFAADEAVDQLERRLDGAYLAGLPYLRVIHGKGSGRLRNVVREFLKVSTYVRNFEPGSDAEGGEGVTVVHLASG